MKSSAPIHGRWPKITLVTPVLNASEFIEATLQSVLSQQYPDLEYIIIDGGSSDGTVDILKRYEDRLTWWVSETDNGMYDALNKGFAKGTGEVMGWISGTDILHVGSLFVAGSIFRALPKVEWITGIPTHVTADGMTTRVGKVPKWSRLRFLCGANRYIQQESTFWRHTLWRRAGGYVDASRAIAGDFEL